MAEKAISLLTEIEGQMQEVSGSSAGRDLISLAPSRECVKGQEQGPRLEPRSTPTRVYCIVNPMLAVMDGFPAMIKAQDDQALFFLRRSSDRCMREVFLCSREAQLPFS